MNYHPATILGTEAAHQGMRRSSNPFPARTLEHQNWHFGYDTRLAEIYKFVRAILGSKGV